jgi:soluble lytic murein transglycosylase-like protein
MADPEPTIWFRPVVAPSMDLSSRFARGLDTLYAQKRSECNDRYVAFLRAKQARLAHSWSPRKTLARIALRYNPSLGQVAATSIAESIVESGVQHEVDPFLLAALIAHESRFRPDCTSPGGAVGLGQLLPQTARGLGVDPFSPSQNVEGCAKYLAIQMRRWKHSPQKVRLALASYNAGPGAVKRFGGVPPYRVTQRYVAKITQCQAAFSHEAKAERERWIVANSPTMKDLFGANLHRET